MALKVTFYSFTKKLNSTKLPDGVGTVYNCELKDSTDFLSPTIVLRGNSVASYNPTNWNFAKIDEFDRYYNVESWVFNKGFWEANLAIDVLASWRDTIGNSYQYITRASSEFHKNGYIIDNKYLAETVFTTAKEFPKSNPFVDNISDGMVIVGIIGGALTSASASTYYMFTTDNFARFIRALFGNANFIETFLLGTVDPLRLITSCVWFPFLPLGGLPTTTIKFGWLDIDLEIPCELLDSQQSTAIKNLSFNIDHHPDINRGAFLDVAFTRRRFFWQPVGEIALEGNSIAEADTLNMEFNIDMRTGAASYIILADNDPFAFGNCQIGVSVPFATITINPLEVAKSAFVLASALQTGGATSIIASSLSAANSVLPQVQSGGTLGAFHAYVNTKPVIISEFFTLTDEEPRFFGYPVFNGLVIRDVIDDSDPEKYILCENAHINIVAGNTVMTITEQRQIIDFLNGGFYYE